MTNVQKVVTTVAVAAAVVGGVMLSMSEQTRYTATLDTTTLSEGTHTIVAEAFDAAGNSTTDTITIVVDNYPDSVTSATATPALLLAWKRPGDSVGSRVVESQTSYPTTAAAGTKGQAVVYTGTGQAYTDKTPARFYSVFSKDARGRWSLPVNVKGTP